MIRPTDPPSEVDGYNLMYYAARDIKQEARTAQDRFPPFNSAHEGFAVLAEEVDELWEEVRCKQGARDLDRMRKEAVQVGAMALRFIVDICDAGKGRN